MQRSLSVLVLAAIAALGPDAHAGKFADGVRRILRRTPRPQRDLSVELKTAQELAREAGALVMRYRGKVETEYKDGDEPVTKADRESSALIVGALQKRFPGDLIITEENKSNWNHLRFARRVWFVDPIDGTKDYIKGEDGFSVMIGLVDKPRLIGAGKPVLGVVYQPSLDRMYYASPQVGARVLEGGEGQPLRPSATTELSRLRLLLSGSNPDPKSAKVQAQLGITETQKMGSVGVKLGVISGGGADITFKPTAHNKPWDNAAPHAILEAAGGHFTKMDGSPLNYNKMIDTGGMLATNGAAHELVLRHLEAAR
jgi:3'(2'), 5'-bisphosphate nucleotidase